MLYIAYLTFEDSVLPQEKKNSWTWNEMPSYFIAHSFVPSAFFLVHEHKLSN